MKTETGSLAIIPRPDVVVDVATRAIMDALGLSDIIERDRARLKANNNLYLNSFTKENKMASNTSDVGPVMPRGKAQLIKQLALKGFNYAKDIAVSSGTSAGIYALMSGSPQEAANAAEHIQKSGGDLAEMLGGSPQMVSAVLDTLGRFGVPIGNLELGDLNKLELSQYTDVIQKWADMRSLEVDSNQSSVGSSGSAELDRIAINLEIEQICKALAINSHTYAVLLRGINSHTSDDVEQFQLHRRMYGLQAI